MLFSSPTWVQILFRIDALVQNHPKETCESWLIQPLARLLVFAVNCQRGNDIFTYTLNHGFLFTVDCTSTNIEGISTCNIL